MTCTIYHFPARARANPDRRGAIVIAARAMLRSPAKQSDDALTEACVALQDYGDARDYLMADAMLLAIRRRQDVRVDPQCVSDRTGERRHIGRHIALAILWIIVALTLADAVLTTARNAPIDLARATMDGM